MAKEKEALGIEIKEFLKTGFPEGFELDFDGTPDKELDLDNLVDNELYELSSDNFGLLVDENDGCRTFSQAFSAWKRKKK
jgi:hypothetical protein